MTRIILIAILVAVHIVFGCPSWLAGDEADYWLRAFSYSAFHANWWHLAVNCLAIWTIFSPRLNGKPLQNVAAFLIAVLVYPLSLRPVVGISNLLYAVIGLRTPSFSSRWWKSPGVIVFLVVTFLMLFIPQFSATTHIAALSCGVLLATVKRGLNSLLKDARRYIK